MTFQRTIVIPKPALEKPAMVDRWFIFQLLAMVISVSALAWLLWAGDSMAAGRIMTEPEVEKSFQDWLASQSTGFGPVQARRVAEIHPVLLPEGDLTFTWKGPAIPTVSQPSVFTLKIENDRGWSTRVPVTMALGTSIDTWVATKVVAARALLSEDDFTHQRITVAPGAVARYVSGTLPRNMRMHSMVAPGATLLKMHLEKLPAITAGTVVDLVLRDGRLSVRMPALARKDGHRGELIPVESRSDKKIFEAKVVNDHVVEVAW